MIFLALGMRPFFKASKGLTLPRVLARQLWHAVITFTLRFHGRAISGKSVTASGGVRSCCRQRCRQRVLIRGAGRVSQSTKPAGQRPVLGGACR